MAIDIAAIVTEENKGRLKNDIVNGDGTPDIAYLDRLRDHSRPVVQSIADDLRDEYGLISNINDKKPDTAEEKCRRPAVLNKYPWFTLGHIRDYLRFRTHLRKASDFEDVLRSFVGLQDAGRISIVKVDWAKLVDPGPYGWRMIAVDLRIADGGMLVEHYMAFDDMIAVNEDWLHKVYEKWRSMPLPIPKNTPLKTLRAYQRDTRFSRHAYRELLFDGVLRTLPDDALPSQQRGNAQRVILNELRSIFIER